MVCYSLKTLDKLEEVEAKEKQIESKHATTKAATMLFSVLVLLLTKVNPFAKIKVPLLSLRV
jgi:hypothetical protein